MAVEARYRRIVETLPVGIWTVDLDARIDFANERIGDLLGRAPGDLLGRTPSEFVFPEDAAAVQARFERHRAGETGHGELRLRHRDGHEIWALVSGSPVHDAEGRLRSVLNTFTDITARRLEEKTVIESDRRKDAFLSLLGHELRTPLSPILTAAKLLEAKGPADPQLEKARQIIIRQTLHMTKLVDDLLDVGRIGAGKLRLTRQVTELGAIVNEAVDTCTPLIEEKQQELVVTLPRDLTYVNADSRRFVQVLCNLLNNAAKYTQPRGRIELSAFRQGSLICIRVLDNGVGLGPDMLEWIFDPFVQVSTTAYGADGGLGLGLALVKSVVELHGGVVAARSEGIGKGSEFEIRLPSVEPPADSAA
ncbi:MAG: PAS domain-containing sensor histidine kinase [Vicinamibacterales bacterium]